MQIGSVTTPFGRRPMTLALIKGQLDSAKIKSGRTIDKWKVFRDACEAREFLGIGDRTLSVLNALLSFYPEKDLSEGRGLIVFPSNNQLSLRAHGITGTTLRRHIAALVDAGLITRKDSPNGKRYAHKSRAGAVEDAFGFNLAPLLSRADELQHHAEKVIAERKALRLAKERLSLCRRDIRKFLAACIDNHVPGDWQQTETRFDLLLAGLARAPKLADIEQLNLRLDTLRHDIVNCLETQLKTAETAASDSQTDRHIQNSDSESLIEPVPPREGQAAAKSQQDLNIKLQDPKIFPLGMVLKACPDISMYGPGGRITGWRDMMSASHVVATMLGVSSSAYRQACISLGPENAATAMACILERGSQVNSAGGYLRDLTRRAQSGSFSVGPMLMALMRDGTDKAAAGTAEIWSGQPERVVGLVSPEPA